MFCRGNSRPVNEYAERIYEHGYHQYQQPAGNYIIRTDSTTGIDTLTVAGEEGFHSQMMITDSEQLQKLQDLADIYKQKYPNVVTSSEAALNFARGEVLGFNFQTPNGIMIANQTGMIYMDDKNPDNDWGISYD